MESESGENCGLSQKIGIFKKYRFLEWAESLSGGGARIGAILASGHLGSHLARDSPFGPKDTLWTSFPSLRGSGRVVWLCGRDSPYLKMRFREKTVGGRVVRVVDELSAVHIKTLKKGEKVVKKLRKKPAWSPLRDSFFAQKDTIMPFEQNLQKCRQAGH